MFGWVWIQEFLGCGMVRPGEAWSGRVKSGPARHREVWFGKVWGKGLYGYIRFGQVGHGVARQCLVRFGYKSLCGAVMHGRARFGLVVWGWVWFGYKG